MHSHVIQNFFQLCLWKLLQWLCPSYHQLQAEINVAGLQLPAGVQVITIRDHDLTSPYAAIPEHRIVAL